MGQDFLYIQYGLKWRNRNTICPRSVDPFYNLQYKMGQDIFIHTVLCTEMNIPQLIILCGGGLIS